MNNNLNIFIKLKENIDESDYNDINKLKNICFDYDKTYLKLETDYKLNNINTYSDNLKHINEFMFFHENKLIAYAGICDFGGDAIEVNGMVHPDYRRKGIFTRLFSLVKDEFCKRDAKEMLLLSDNSSYGGIEFIKKTSNSYDHSEYDMNLDMNVTHEVNLNDLIFRKALRSDAKNMAKENFEFFGEYDFEGIADEKGELNSSNCTYLIELNNVIIGKSRLEVNENIGGIYGLEVLPDYRGKGFGRKLLLLSINKLKEKGVSSITLQVETNNKNALNLYTSCGFKENYTMTYYSIKK